MNAAQANSIAAAKAKIAANTAAYVAAHPGTTTLEAMRATGAAIVFDAAIAKAKAAASSKSSIPLLILGGAFIAALIWGKKAMKKRRARRAA